MIARASILLSPILFMLACAIYYADSGVMNTVVPDATDNGAIWSGLQLGDEALARAFTQNETPAKFTFTPFAGSDKVELEASPAVTTWILRKTSGSIKAEIQAPQQK